MEISEKPYFILMYAGNGVERIHTVRQVHLDGEEHRMPRKQGCLPRMSENAISCT